MFAISNDELEKASRIEKSIKCELCGKRHKVKYGKREDKATGECVEDKMLAFYNCGSESYLCGINGKGI